MRAHDRPALAVRADCRKSPEFPRFPALWPIAVTRFYAKIEGTPRMKNPDRWKRPGLECAAVDPSVCQTGGP
jgi:hypothetical protein